MASQHDHQPVTTANFSRAFQQMCSIFAIAKTRSADETIRELILQCLALLPDERFFYASQLCEAIYVLFGLQVPEHEVQDAIEFLIHERKLDHFPGNCLTLPLEIKEHLLRKIEEAGNLENRIKEGWLEEVSDKYPLLISDEIWKALKIYLAGAFRRHGLQAVSLLNPLMELSNENGKSLSIILNEATKRFPPDLQNQVRSAISNFMANIGSSADRTQYISQLADGAFNYYSLTTAPDIAEEFRNQLSPLTIFLDTNFLFGILGISTGPQVLVSNELVKAINKYHFPFSLKYHEKTRRELLASIDYYKERISSQNLSQALSRAAITSPFLSGVEHKFHEQYAREGIDAETFFRKFEHADFLLEEKHIDLYSPTVNRIKERSALFESYQNYLLYKQKEKPYELIDHDATVLNEVRHLRSKLRSSLEAEALLVTCDYQLYLYDWEQSRKNHSLPCAILPNLFWQLIRPFVPSDIEFDRSFVETFAIPEFRTIGSGSSDACSKALEILSSYRDFPEETATRLLSNDVLIERLRATKDDSEFKQLVESAIVDENSALVEEKAIMASQLEKERYGVAERDSIIGELKTQLDMDAGKVQEAESEAFKAQIRAKEILEEERKKIILIEAEKTNEQIARQDAERRAKEAEEETRIVKEYVKTIRRAILTILTSVFFIVIFELLAIKIPWSWLMTHPNSIVIQICINAILVTFIVGLINPRIRKWWWGTALFGLITTILSLIKS